MRPSAFAVLRLITRSVLLLRSELLKVSGGRPGGTKPRIAALPGVLLWTVLEAPWWMTCPA